MEISINARRFLGNFWKMSVTKYYKYRTVAYYSIKPIHNSFLFLKIALELQSSRSATVSKHRLKLGDKYTNGSVSTKKTFHKFEHNELFHILDDTNLDDNDFS